MNLDGQIHGLFAELLARKTQPRKTQKIVRSVYSFLQATGEISPAADEAADGVPDSAADTAERTPEGRSDEGAGGEIPAWATGGVTARRPSHPGASSLRSLFHRLAEALHPDKVQDEHEKAERTDVMKELTQAYQAGDLAQLLDLERRWLLSADQRQEAPERTEEEALVHRCAQLEKTNLALRLQLDEVNRELRNLRRAPQAEFVSALKRMSSGSKKDPVEVWLQMLREQREGLSVLLAFVRSYHESRIDIREFERGPQTARWDDQEPGGDELELLQELLDGLAAMANPPRSRRRSRRSDPKRVVDPF